MNKNKNTAVTTRKDIEDLHDAIEILAKDLRSDMTKFATKEDLKGLKKEMKSFATKQDLKRMVDAISMKFVEVNNEMKKEIHNDILSFKDDIVHDYVKVQDDFVVVKGWSDKIEDHEERIVRLESC